MRHLLLFITMFLSLGFAQAQNWEGLDLDGLKAAKADKEAMIEDAEADIESIQKMMDEYPGWTNSLVGTIGGNFNGFSNWIGNADINSTSNSIVADIIGALRYNDDKQFLYNEAAVALGRVSNDLDTNVPGSPDAAIAPNKLNLSSLYGYKIMKNLALSAGLQYNTGILGDNIFNNPGRLDIGAGVTWTPFDAFYLMVHPLNYNWTFGDNPDFSSAAGAKIKAGYNREILKGIAWVSTLEAFFPYSTSTYGADAGILAGTDKPSSSFYEWTNTFAFNVWKGIGVGATYGIRKADSESSETQSRYSVGLSYAL